MVLVLKNPPANAGDKRDGGSISGSGRSSGGGHGNPLQYSCLENTMDRGAQRVGHNWSNLACTCTHAHAHTHTHTHIHTQARLGKTNHWGKKGHTISLILRNWNYKQQSGNNWSEWFLKKCTFSVIEIKNKLFNGLCWVFIGACRIFSWGIQDLRSSSPTRGKTQVPCTGSVES